MIIERITLLPAALLVLMLLGSIASAVDSESAAEDEGPITGGSADILRMLGKLPIPSLDGLIKPEKMGLLTDNQCTVKDNNSQLFSENEREVNLLSGNEAHILSGIRILSGFSVNVHITLQPSEKKAPKRKTEKADKKRKGQKRKNVKKPKTR